MASDRSQQRKNKKPSADRVSTFNQVMVKAEIAATITKANAVFDAALLQSQLVIIGKRHRPIEYG